MLRYKEKTFKKQLQKALFYTKIIQGKTYNRTKKYPQNYTKTANMALFSVSLP